MSTFAITLYGGPEDGTKIDVPTLADGTVPKDLYYQGPVHVQPTPTGIPKVVPAAFDYHYLQGPKNPHRYDYQGEEKKP